MFVEEKEEYELGENFVLYKKKYMSDRPENYTENLIIHITKLNKQVIINSFRSIDLKKRPSVFGDMGKDYQAYCHFNREFLIDVNNKRNIVKIKEKESEKFYDWIKYCRGDKRAKRDYIIDNLLDD